MAKKRVSLGVDWMLPKKAGGYYKQPFASTTQASSDLIEMLAEDGSTWADLVERIRYDPEARGVAQRFVDEGYGSVAARDFLNLYPGATQ